jgi:hypothetical protein
LAWAKRSGVAAAAHGFAVQDDAEPSSLPAMIDYITKIAYNVMQSFTGRSAALDIGIIGSGNIGSTRAQHLTALGHHVSIANSRGPASLAAATGTTAAMVEQAARGLLDTPRERALSRTRSGAGGARALRSLHCRRTSASAALLAAVVRARASGKKQR